MKRQVLGALGLILLSLASIGSGSALGQPPEGDPPGPPPPPPGERRPPPPRPIVERALDADGDGEISSEEIEGAVAALKKLDQNGDGKLAGDEIRPKRPPMDGNRPAGNEGRPRNEAGPSRDGTGRPRNGEGRPRPEGAATDGDVKPGAGGPVERNTERRPRRPEAGDRPGTNTEAAPREKKPADGESAIEKPAAGAPPHAEIGG